VTVDVLDEVQDLGTPRIKISQGTFIPLLYQFLLIETFVLTDVYFVSRS
jgi:hypothetical protein